MLYLSNLLPAVALFIAFVYGAGISFKKDGVLFLQIVTAAVGCMMFGKLFEFLLIVCNGELFEGFNVGMLGIVGSYFFFLSASFGQLDSLGDDGSKEMRKYRIIPFAVVIALLAIFLFFDLRSGVNPKAYIVNAVMLIPVSITTYYNVKHLIIPDVEFGILRSIRQYNLSMLLTSATLMISILFTDYQYETGAIIANLIMTAGYLTKILHAKKGVDRWYI